MGTAGDHQAGIVLHAQDIRILCSFQVREAASDTVSSSASAAVKKPIFGSQVLIYIPTFY